jgi:phosphatidylglycerophosphate synthase
MAKAPVYKAEDRSILLPYYKRFLVDPTLPFIPARIHPNSITHAGHLVCLAGAGVLVAMQPTRGWVFLLAAFLLFAYLWADNADGAHARRTKQSSAFGEFLDHGLDILNTVYIGVITAMTLGTSPMWTVAIVMMIPAAASITCWEQTQTGVYRLGLLNQIESCLVLVATMACSAVMGTPFYRSVAFHGFSLYDFLVWWPTATIVFGYGRAIHRVAREGAPLSPALVFLAIQICILTGAAMGWFSVLVACSFATAANVLFGVRMLVLRLQGEPPRVERPLVAALVGLVAFLGYRAAGFPLHHGFGVVIATVVCLGFALLAALDTRQGVQVLARVEGR